MSRPSIHLARQRAEKIETRFLEGSAGSDARGRKWRHLLFEGFLEGPLASDARVDDGLARLEPLQHPDRLSQLRQDVFWTSVAFVEVRGSDERLHVFVVAWKDDRILGLVVDVRIEDAAADADESVVAYEGVEGA